MSARVFTVKLAPPGPGPKTLREALALAEKTGVLELPRQALQLTINSGQPVEMAHGE